MACLPPKTLVRELLQPIDRGSNWPTYLQELSFGNYFNQSVVGVTCPTYLQEPSFGNQFNQSIVGVAWPASVRKLSIERHFDRIIAGVAWPVYLQTLFLQGTFNQPIVGKQLPSCLLKLTLGCNFDQAADAAVAWPPSRTFYCHFDQYHRLGGMTRAYAQCLVRLHPTDSRSRSHKFPTEAEVHTFVEEAWQAFLDILTSDVLD